MGLVKLKCKKCGEILDEDEIVEAIVSSLDNTIIITICCWNCGANEEVEIPIPNFLEIIEEIG